MARETWVRRPATKWPAGKKPVDPFAPVGRPNPMNYNHPPVPSMDPPAPKRQR